MKNKELKSLQKPELESKLTEIKKELMKENAQIALGSSAKNPGKIRVLKKSIARINLLLNQKEDKKE